MGFPVFTDYEFSSVFPDVNTCELLKKRKPKNDLLSPTTSVAGAR